MTNRLLAALALALCLCAPAAAQDSKTYVRERAGAPAVCPPGTLTIDRATGVVYSNLLGVCTEAGVASLPVSDATAFVKGSGDATKRLRFEVDGFTPGATRVLTAPDYDGQVATLAGAETLANKTLTAPAVASFANAQHSHQSAAGGGGLDAAAVGSGTLNKDRVPGTLNATSAPSFSVSGSAGAGFVEFAPQSSAPAAPATNYIREYASAAGLRCYIRSLGFSACFDSTGVTASRNYTLPDASITLYGATSALTSNRLARITGAGTIGNALLNDDGANIQLTSGLFQLHGTTSSFPAWKRSGTTLAARLADDSADAPVSASTITSTVATGTAPLTVTSTTPVTNLHTSPVVYNEVGTQQTGYRWMINAFQLSGGTLTVNLSGAAAFSSVSSYHCVATDRDNASAVKIAKVSAAQFVITGSGSDTVSVICAGN